MRMTYVFHIAAGSLGLLSGYIALFASKGGPMHRRSGTVFVYAMLAMCLGGFTIAVTRDVAQAINVPVAFLTTYLVVTSLTTVRPLRVGDRWLTIVALAVVLGVGVATVTFGLQAVANGGMRKGMPAALFFVFAGIATLGAIGDARVLRSGALAGARRIARHLWRMSFALFFAALSFFLGQAQVFPKPIRIYPLLAVPVVLVLVMMLYWLWRVRLRKSLSGLIVGRMPDAALLLRSRT